MSVDIQTYDPTLVNITIGGRVMRMFGDDMFTLERSNDSVTPKVGVKGDTTYSLSMDKSGTFVFTLQQHSPDLPYIRQLAEEKKLVPITINDANDGGILQHLEKCMVAKPPAVSRKKEVEDCEITMLCPEIVFK